MISCIYKYSMLALTSFGIFYLSGNIALLCENNFNKIVSSIIFNAIFIILTISSIKLWTIIKYKW